MSIVAISYECSFFLLYIFCRSQQWYAETQEGHTLPSQHLGHYSFTFPRELQNPCHLLFLVPCIIMVFISMFISYTYGCNRWMTIVELCGNMFLVACDVLFLLRFPKFPIFTLSTICTIVACVMQCAGDYVWCQHLDWTHNSFLSYLPYVILLPYCVKVCLLRALLKTNFITLQSMLLLDCHRHVLLSYPITTTYHTPKPIYELDNKSESLLTVAILIPVLEGLLLRCRHDILEGHDNTTYYDENMEVTAMYIATKQCLLLSEAALKELHTEYEEVSRKLECVKKSHGEVKNQRDDFKKQLDDQNKQSDTISKNLDKANKAVEDLRKQLSKQQENINCYICQDRMKTILLRPCNHLSVCEQCLEEVLTRRDKLCPLCWVKIEEHIKVLL